MIRCIVCKQELTKEHPGFVLGQISAFACKNEEIRYIPPDPMAYHEECRKEAMKIDYKNTQERLKKMGLVE